MVKRYYQANSSFLGVNDCLCFGVEIYRLLIATSFLYTSVLPEICQLEAAFANTVLFYI